MVGGPFYTIDVKNVETNNKKTFKKRVFYEINKKR